MAPLLGGIAERGEGNFKWKFVYIAEAHAMNEWPVHSGRYNRGRGPVVVEKQPTTGEERCELARKFAQDFEMKLDHGSSYEFLVDDPDQEEPFEKAYAPWPLRFYLFKGQTLEWIAEPKNASYEEAAQELIRKVRSAT